MKVMLVIEEDGGRETRLVYPSVSSFEQSSQIGGWISARWKIELPANTDWLRVE